MLRLKDFLKIEIVFDFASKNPSCTEPANRLTDAEEPLWRRKPARERINRNRLRYYNSRYRSVSIFFTKQPEHFVAESIDGRKLTRTQRSARSPL